MENGLLYFEVWGHPADQKDQKPMYAEAESKGKTGNKEAKVNYTRTLCCWTVARPQCVIALLLSQFSHRVKPSVVNLQRVNPVCLPHEHGS